jgi:hypothetical protein
MEDDLVRKCEIEKQEKEKQKEDASHMIFERHFEDGPQPDSSKDILE